MAMFSGSGRSRGMTILVSHKALSRVRSIGSLTYVAADKRSQDCSRCALALYERLQLNAGVRGPYSFPRDKSA